MNANTAAQLIARIHVPAAQLVKSLTKAQKATLGTAHHGQITGGVATVKVLIANGLGTAVRGSYGHRAEITIEGTKVLAILDGDADFAHAELIDEAHAEAIETSAKLEQALGELREASAHAMADRQGSPERRVIEDMWAQLDRSSRQFRIERTHGEALMMDRVIDQARQAQKAREHKAAKLEQAHAEALNENALRDEFGAGVAAPAVDSTDLVDIARSIITGNALSALELIWSLADEATRARLVASAERLATDRAKDMGVYDDGAAEADAETSALELARRLADAHGRMTLARADRFAHTWTASLRLAQRLINAHNRMGIVTYSASEHEMMRMAVKEARNFTK
jgi:hypothetical protein